MGVDDPGSAIDAFFNGESTSRPYQPYISFGNFQPNSCRYQSPFPWRNRNFFGCGYICASITCMRVLRNRFAGNPAGKWGHAGYLNKVIFGDYIRGAKKENRERGWNAPSFPGNLQCYFWTVLDIGEKLSCDSGKDGALPIKERRRATIFPRYHTRGQKWTPLYANWIDIICRDKSQSSAGAQNVWGFGKGFETAIHPTGCCKQYKFGMHLIHYNGILFSSNPPLEDLYSVSQFL